MVYSFKVWFVVLVVALLVLAAVLFMGSFEPVEIAARHKGH